MLKMTRELINKMGLGDNKMNKIFLSTLLALTLVITGCNNEDS